MWESVSAPSPLPARGAARKCGRVEGWAVGKGKGRGGTCIRRALGDIGIATESMMVGFPACRRKAASSPPPSCHGAAMLSGVRPGQGGQREEGLPGRG